MPRFHRVIAVLLLSAAVIGSGCHKKSKKSKSSKKKREDLIQKASNEQAALDTFVGSVREVLVWYQAQPVASDADRVQTRKVLAQKMEAVPVKDLPDALAKAWDPMLKAWQAIAKTDSSNATLREQGAKAAEELNRQLAAHGVMGIKF